MSEADYFDTDAFRAWAAKGAVDFTDDEIEAAQEEVVERLEAWARTAWQEREATETFDVGLRGYVLGNLPVVSVDGVTLDGEAVGVDAYVPDLTAGILWYDTSAFRASSAFSAHQAIAVSYTYGYDAVPRSVVRSCMAATATLLPHVAEQKKGKIPDNTTEYVTEGATFVIQPGDGEEPWPWDAVASRDIRNYWGPHRPLTVGRI